MRFGPSSAQKWEEFRKQFPVTAKWAYFDNAAVAPVSAAASQAIQKWLHESLHDGDTAWPLWAKRVEQARKTAAVIVNADPAEIAFVPNTTFGISLVAEGFPWKTGDNVITLANEFPSNQYPWLNLQSRGVEIRRVAPRIEDIVKALDQRTRIVSVSWVGYATGWRFDLGELASIVHSKNALLFVDAIQGLGAQPLDVKQTGIDFFAADGHKWLLSPEGAGLFFIRHELLDLLRPIGVGWNSVTQGNDYSRIELSLRPTAARYEGGSQNMVGVIGLGASLELLSSYGLGPNQSAIGDRVLALTDLACERLRTLGAEISSVRDAVHSSGIVSFEFPGKDPQELRKRCLAAQVVLSCRAGKLRISPHAYANEEDIERLVGALSGKD